MVAESGIASASPDAIAYIAFPQGSHGQIVRVTEPTTASD
jgi:hypothetical protein